MTRLILISVGAIVSNYIPLSLPVVVVEGSIGRSAILSSVGARLLINMKEAGEKGLNQGTSCPSHSTASSIDFAEAPGGGDGETSQDEEIEMEDIRGVDGIEVEEVCEIDEAGIGGICGVEEV